MAVKYLMKMGVVGARSWTESLIEELKAKDRVHEPLKPQLVNQRPALPDHVLAYESLCREEKSYAVRESISSILKAI